MLKVLIHLAIIIAIGALIVLGFFYVYLPATTNHGETLTVPDLEGIAYENLDDFLTKRNLRYEVNDSSYSAEFPPLTVLMQDPKPGSKVKENRKIYIGLNAQNPPNVKMPRLIDGSVKNAQMVLESYQLLLGEITYVPDLAQNAVLEQWYNGKAIESGTSIPKGSKIDLVVGDGLGNQVFEVPNVIGMPVDEAKTLIIGSGLQVESVTNEVSEENTPGTVIRQTPPAGGDIRIGASIDLWVADFVEGQTTPSEDGSLIEDLEAGGNEN